MNSMIFGHDQDDQEGQECPKTGDLEDFRCLDGHISYTNWSLPISNHSFYFSKLINLKEYVPKELIEYCAWVLITILWRKNEKNTKKKLKIYSYKLY